MKTQISRRRRTPFHDYSGVYQQQGRMLADADWNELTDLEKARLAAALQVTVAGGTPRTNGLRITGTPPAILPGWVVVDGHLGRHADLPDDGEPSPVAPDDQSDYPYPPEWSAPNRTLYVDVWERSVTALEDESLLDAALHGADTCTRSRTLVQVKWCDAGIDPMDPEQNPPMGTAGLRLQLRKVFQSGDPCDPCSEEVPVDERIGNYLFRVEVHDVYEEDGATRVVLKWSRENGAEQHPVGDEPPGFGNGDWIWEYFDSDTENLAGHHFPAGARRRRGILKTALEPPSAEDMPEALGADEKVPPDAFVRRWDGYAILDPDAQTVIEGRDRGIELSDALAAEQHGWFRFADGVWEANLEWLVCRLQVADAAFVAGDYWLTPVREAEHAPGSHVLGDESVFVTPQGIEHHYMVLGQTDGAGQLVPPNDAERRQRNFPPLSDLHAADVGFDNTCERLFADAENVQAALDALCAIDARDIAYPLPECKNGVSSLLAEGDASWPDRDGDARMTVGDVLDGLLCDLDARHVPLDKTDLCPELADTNVRTVQDALERLCAYQRDYCAIPVEPGTLEGLLEAFAADQQQQRLSLCLLPGEHTLPSLELTGKEFLLITGAGDLQSRVVIAGERNRLAIRQVRLQNLEVRISPPEGTLIFECNALDVQGCRFYRSGTERAKTSMLQIRGTGLTPRTRWHDNHVQSTWTRSLFDKGFDPLFPPDLVGPDVAAEIGKFQERPELVDGSPEYAAKLGSIAEKLAALPEDDRKQLTYNIRGGLAQEKLFPEGGLLENNTRFARQVKSKNLAGAVGSWPKTGGSAVGKEVGSVNVNKANAESGKAADNAIDKGGKKSVLSAMSIDAGMDLAVDDLVPASTAMEIAYSKWGAGALYDYLNSAPADTTDVDWVGKGAISLDGLIGLLTESGISPAFTILDTGLDVTLQHNRIEGELILANETKAAQDPIEIGTQTIADIPLVGDGRLTLQDCQVSRLIGQVERGLINGGASGDGFSCFHTIQILDSTFDEDGSSAIAVQLDCRGNHFNAVVTGDDNVAVIWLRANQLMFTVNMAAGATQSEARIIAESRLYANNLMRVNTGF